MACIINSWDFCLFFFLFSGVNLKIYFLGCDTEKTLQWQAEELFLDVALPVMWELKHFLCLFLLLFPVCFSDIDLSVVQVREMPLLQFLTVSSSEKTSAMQYLNTNHEKYGLIADTERD